MGRVAEVHPVQWRIFPLGQKGKDSYQMHQCRIEGEVYLKCGHKVGAQLSEVDRDRNTHRIIKWQSISTTLNCLWIQLGTVSDVKPPLVGFDQR